MFENLFKQDATIHRYRAAPLARSRLDYLVHRASQGASRSTLQGIAADQVAATRYLELGQERKIQPSALEGAAQRRAAECPERRNRNDGKPRRLFFGRVAAWLRFAGLWEAGEAAAHPYKDELEEFVNYMREQRGWSEVTIRVYRGRVGEFLTRFGCENGPLAGITVADIDRQMVAKGTRDGCRRSTIQTYAHALRAFFRFAEERGWCAPGLAAAISTPRVYRQVGVPVGPSWDDVRRLLATTDGDHPVKLRDRAILLLLSVYGLRAAEVRGLKLDDLDWEAATFRVARPKSGRSDVYPLSRTVGDAIVRYLSEARPRSGLYREIFLTSNAPFRPLQATSIVSLVRHRMQCTGITCMRRGSHALRHACAQRLLDLTLQEIGNYLGHRHPESTAIYAKVDLAGLRQIADFDLEGLV